ncbi:MULTISPECIES: ComEC/Rec2 family competence protein [Cryobacterium]|uniref:MBL fold metallo-hydrolase n=1 Tax=Cryobacterium breve TaxID=1259258 RepID=A0ABY2IYA4_9MICO|nr:MULTISPECIES: ComEC/Rec2 family competence protein [Cryobacterium]TFC96695.1 MBL fold metallo-hydrolase [Cryobacterium sp. TmT3-12]TFC97508.1 MBL fold metallo-hydrolase [Cryobacterium breve]
MEPTNRIDLRLVLPAVFAWLAAWLLIAFPEWAPGSQAALWTGAVCLALAAWRRNGYRRRRVSRQGGDTRWPRLVGRSQVWGMALVCCAAAALVASAVTVAAANRLPATVRDSAARQESLTVILTVASIPVQTQSFGASAPFGTAGFRSGESMRVRFRGTLTGIEPGGSERQDAAHRLSVPVVVFAETASDEASALHIGGVVRLDATLRLTAAGDAASALVFGRGPPETIAPPPWWLGWAGELRSRFTAAATALPGDGGDLLPGLAIGDTSAVGADLDTAMKTSSLSHLTAVSGANCAVVIAGVMLLTGFLGLSRGIRIGLSLATLLGFVVLVTPEPSVLRAALMATILLLGIASGRPGRGLPLLALVVILLLAADPWLARSYGFALSVLATAGLLVLAAPLTRMLSRLLPIWLAAVIAIPLAAQLACQPVLVLLSPTLPLYGVPANLLAGPAAPAATVIGLIACLLLPWLPGVAGGVLHLAWLPAAWIAAIARMTAELPGSRLPWLGGVLGVLVTALLTVAVVALVLRRRTDARTHGGNHGRTLWPIAAIGVLVLATGSYAGSLLGAGVGRAVVFPADWQIAACDIGQGDAVIVRDHDRYALVDVGPDPALLTECLDSLGIERIDLLVLTHYDLDHIGGAAAVIGRVDMALVGIPENDDDERLHDALVAGGAEIREAARGDTGTLGGLRWEVLWPVRGAPSMQTGNDGSVTIGFDGQGIRSLFLGDLGAESQSSLRRVSSPGVVDVVKVAHHGSGDQSPELYAELGATVGLISVGRDNGYGHPTDEILAILASAGTVAMRTDRQGMLVVAPAPEGGGALTVWTERIDGGEEDKPVTGPG